MAIADDGSTLTITVPLSNLSTGDAGRDQFTKTVLQVGSYPNVVLTVSRGALKFPASGASTSGTAQGSLTVHGRTVGITFHYSAKAEGRSYVIQANAEINVDGYGITRPSYKGLTIVPALTISTSFQAEDS